MPCTQKTRTQIPQQIKTDVHYYGELVRRLFHPRKTRSQTTKLMKTDTYQHNGLNRRVKKVNASETRAYYYNRNWQCVEEYKPGCNVRRVFGLRYADDLIYHQRGDTRYAMHDANWNVVAMFNTTSNVIEERYTYSAFGRASAFDAAFTARTAPSFYCDAAFTGQLREYETGLMLYRNRVYHPRLGRFLQRDPIGYDAGDMSLYRYVGNQVTIKTDVLGLQGVPVLDWCRNLVEWGLTVQAPANCKRPSYTSPPQRPENNNCINQPKNPCSNNNTQEDLIGALKTLVGTFGKPGVWTPALQIAAAAADLCNACDAITIAIAHEKKAADAQYNRDGDLNALNDRHRDIEKIKEIRNRYCPL